MREWCEQVYYPRGAEEVAYRETHRPCPDTDHVLLALRERGLPPAVVSDFARDLRTHLARHRLDARR